MPQTVLMIVSTLARSGPINVLLGVIRHFDPLRFRAAIATISPEPADSRIEDFRSLGVHVKQMGLSRVGSLISGIGRLRRLVSEVEPDIVHSHGFRADVLAATARLGRPIISTLHCDLHADYRLAFGRGLGTLMANGEYSALRRFDGVVAVSGSVAEAASRPGIGACAIPNGVELDEYRPPRDLHEVQAFRARLGWPADAVVLLHTGSLTSRKNPVDVVTGFRASGLTKSGLLVFAGNGPLRAKCKRAAGEASNILFLGDRRDIPDLLRAADILISASTSEGLPMALLEGCASGIPVLATDIPAHQCIQQSFPDQMRIFANRDWKAVGDAIDGFRSKQRFQPPPSALEAISSRRMSSQYQEFYSELLRSRSREISMPGKVA